ncbi:hypothetical protein H1R20_g10261, partial [Candolleomyces eurysporus]
MIPITVFTGFLGAGKTSIILSLLPKLPKDYSVVLLKNEFGDVEVDSKLASSSSNLTAVNEILNGCLCCVLVGQMQSALLEIKEKFSPDRIIIECSGSAFPATLAFQIRQLEKDTEGAFKLDAIVTVIDAENFAGYEDTSPTARMQASYSDVILINKWEHVSERQLDVVLDHLHTLNDLTPKIKCQGRDGVDPDLIFGLDSQLFRLEERERHEHPHSHSHPHTDEVQTFTISSSTLPTSLPTKAQVEDTILKELSKEVVYRLKGFILLAPSDPQASSSLEILNWAFGRWDWTRYQSTDSETTPTFVRLTIMGERGPQLRNSGKKVAQLLGAEVVGNDV